MSDDRMPAFVISDNAPLTRVDKLILFFQSPDNALDSFFKIRHPDLFMIIAGGKQRRFITHIRDLRTGESRCLRCKPSSIHVGIKNKSACMDFEYLASAVHIRTIEQYLPIEPTGTQKGGVKHVRTICCRHENNTHARIEA